MHVQGRRCWTNHANPQIHSFIKDFSDPFLLAVFNRPVASRQEPCVETSRIVREAEWEAASESEVKYFLRGHKTLIFVFSLCYIILTTGSLKRSRSRTDEPAERWPENWIGFVSPLCRKKTTNASRSLAGTAETLKGFKIWVSACLDVLVRHDLFRSGSLCGGEWCRYVSAIQSYDSKGDREDKVKPWQMILFWERAPSDRLTVLLWQTEEETSCDAECECTQQDWGTADSL